MNLRILVLAGVVLFTGLGAAQSGGTFRAQVAIERPRGESADKSGVVVWLTPVTTGVPIVAPAAGRFRLLQKDKQFEPHLLVIPVGSTVDFPNQDPFFHNVFSLYKGRRFDLGLYEAGGSKSVVFDRPGVSFIFCNIHSEMSGVVITMTTPHYGVSNAGGEVVIKNVPPGKYRLEAWYEFSSPEALRRVVREVTLPDDDSAELHIADVVEGPVQHQNKFGKDYERSPTY